MNGINDKVNSQVKSFYSNRKKISHRNQVDYVITDDVFSKRLELAKSERDKRKTVENMDFLNLVNGNVVWGRTNSENITVIISSKVFSLDNYTWRGTVHHEYTHAHDYWDLADYLSIYNMDDIYDYQFYTAFHWWSEYHARVAGALNVYQHEYALYSVPSIMNVCRESFAIICRNLMQSPTAYYGMQEYGRYSALKKMYPNFMPDLHAANEKFGLENSLIEVGEFLHSHQDFILVRDSFEQLQKLVNAV